MKLKGSGLPNKKFLPEHSKYMQEKLQLLSFHKSMSFFFSDACLGNLLNNLCYLDELS